MTWQSSTRRDFGWSYPAFSIRNDVQVCGGRDVFERNDFHAARFRIGEADGTFALFLDATIPKWLVQERATFILES